MIYKNQLVVLFVVLFSISVLAQEKNKFVAQSFKQAGFSTGIVSQNSKESETLYFSLPDNKIISSAELILDLEYSSILEKPSHLKVKMDNRPIGLVSLWGEQKSDSLVKKQFKINIPRNLLTNFKVPLTFEFTQSISGDACMDSKIANGLVFIAPTSMLKINLKNQINQINDFLLSLPEESKIYLPARKMKETEFKHFVYLSLFMSQMGKKLVSGAIENADIILADQSEIEKYFLKLESKELIDIYSRNDHQTLVINSSVLGDLRNLNLFSVGLLNQKNATFANGLLVKTSDVESIALTDLGIKGQGQVTSNGQIWNAKISNQDLGKSIIPQILNLSIVSSPSSTNIPVKFYVYLDQILVSVQELDNSGEPQFLSVELPQVIKGNGVELTFQIVRSDSTGKCGEGGSFVYPTSILPDSAIIFAKFNNEANNFMEFARKKNEGALISLPEDSLHNIEFWGKSTTLVLRSLNFNLNKIEFSFGNQQNSKADIEFKSLDKDDNTGSVYFDKTQNALVLQGSLIPGLAINELRNLFVTELSKKDGVEKLIFYALNTQVPANIDFLNIDRNNVSIFEHDRLITSFISENNVKNLGQYSNKSTIKVLYSKYKYYLFAIVWLLITFIFIRIGKKI